MKPAAPRRGIGKWLGRAALVFVSIASVLALAEGLLRYVGAAQVGLETWHTRLLYRPDPDLIFSLRPNASQRTAGEEFVEIASTNAIGLRGGELLELGARPRILILGDSQTFGHGVRDEAPYPRRLQEFFEAQGQAVEVINAGMQGFGSDQSYKLFNQRLRGLRPDLVIFAHYWNDIYDNLSKALYLIEDDRLVELDATGHPIYRLGRIHEALPTPILELRLTRVLFAVLLSVGNVWLTPPDYENRPERWGRKKLFMQLKELDRMGREDGFRLMVLGVPYRDGEPDHYVYLHKPLARSGIPLLDAHAHPVWKRRSAKFFYQRDDHLTELGHHRLARQLHDFIRNSQLLPRREPAPGGREEHSAGRQSRNRS
jgi:hypothetical protein